MPILTRPLVLIGMMGCGKSAVGKRLAKELGVGFSDSDAVIEAQENTTISDIFSSQGEAHFRQLEHDTIVKLLQKGPHIIAVGGGAFMQETIRNAIANYGKSVWIDAPLDILLERVSRKNTRPLLENTDKRATLQKLMQERCPVYAQADYRVQTTSGPHKRVIDNIIELLEEGKT